MASVGRRPARVYEPIDPQLRAFDHGVGTLTVDGELRGYLASVVGRIVFPGRGLWPWFVIVWLDGTKESPFEDYGPGWYTVRELEAGQLDHFGPSVSVETRILWWKVRGTMPGPPTVYDFAWLPADEAAVKWRDLDLRDSDF
jgi:hypothetical protein